MKWSIIIFSLFFIGCDMKNDSTQDNKSERSTNQLSTSENELKKAILFKGDIEAYKSLSTAYLDYSFQEEFLLYAMIMANKYDYPQAYFDVFTCLTDVYLADIGKIDEETANLAIEYLLKAYNKGHHQAKDMVEEYSIMNNQNNIQQIERIFKE